MKRANYTKQRLQELAAIKEVSLDFKQSPEVQQAKDRVMNAIEDLPYHFKDDDDMTLAGMVDGLIAEAVFGGDYDEYDINGGHGMRDKMIDGIIQAMKVAFEKELKMIG